MRSKCLGFFVLAALVASPATAQLLNPYTAGFNIVVPEMGLEHNGVQNGGNWEPYCDAFGDGTLAAASIREEIGDTAITERTFVALFNTDNSVAIVDGFFTETNFPNDPWNTNNDVRRQSGNPARIACDRRPGGTNYLLGCECTPDAFPALFPTIAASGMLYVNYYGCVQFFNKTGLSSVAPLTQLIDPTFIPGDTGPTNGDRRFGGEIRGLSNGGYACVIESRDTSNSPTTPPDRWRPLTTFDSSGTKLNTPINANQVWPASRTTGWSNLAAYNGGFADFGNAVNADGVTRVVSFWNNDRTPAGTWDYIQRTSSGDPLPPAGGFSTSNQGPGSGSRLCGHPASSYVYYVGEGVGGVYITKIDATTRLTVKEVFVNDTFPSVTSRAFGAVDANDNVAVVWSTDDTNQMLCRTYDDNLDPTSDAFYCFENSNNGNFTTLRPSCAIADDGRILITGRFEGGGATDVYPGTFDDDQVAIVIQKAAPPSAVDNWTLLD